ncbi:hypothetical protein ATEIFO6365_0007049800 [Aspergillus terreus]|uniref:Uncharacterized protein n=1 Tax=Aspergillus terreus TaxID=33178 RepID=A0A5M3Z9H8_ASPTE|nr:hypothetical protein ATETN484_0009049800 [Aspergillus terreus]GFF17949.1 hypothetical protein ATEIFO6365_0007049800 [Aspergillus terreus]
MTLSSQAPTDHVALRPWRVLAQSLKFPSEQQRKWWLHTAPFLNSLLEQAGYSIHHQYSFLSFFQQYLVPALGNFDHDSASAFRSLSSDIYPLEMSTNHSSNGRLVRIGMEPLSVHAGTSADPLNQAALLLFLRELAIHFPHLDLLLVNHFESCLSLSPEEYKVAISLPRTEGNTQARFAGFNFQRTGDIVPKAYYAFGAKAAIQGVSKTSLVFKTLRTIDSYSSDPKYSTAVSALEGFFTSTGIEPFLVGTDCIESTKSRIKLYVRAPWFTSAGLRDLWTIGGRVDTPLAAKGLEIAQYFLGLLNYTPEQTNVEPSFSALLANYELKIGSPHPKPQIYFPLHKIDDETAADILTRFFDYLGWQGIASNFKDSLISNMPSPLWKDNKKITKWAAYAYSEAGVYLTVYYNPASAKAGSL